MNLINFINYENLFISLGFAAGSDGAFFLQ